MDEKIIREISDVVTEEVMKQVRTSLSEMKPEIFKELTDKTNTIVTAQLAPLMMLYGELKKSNDQLAQTVADQSKKIKKLESAISSARNGNNSDSILELKTKILLLEQKTAGISGYNHSYDVASLKDKISELEKKITALTTPTQRPAAGIGSATSLSMSQVDEILSFPDYYREGNGWIYYMKPVKYKNDDVALLFKIRPDGTGNQQIFNGYLYNPKYSHQTFDLRGNKLHFYDYENNKRVITV